MLTDGLVVDRPGAPFRYQKVELNAKLRPNKCLVRIHATGVCRTDLHFAASTSDGDASLFPRILGHEGAGTVTAVGEGVEDFEEGDRVIVCFASCGECRYCWSKQSAYCDMWFSLNFGGEEAGEDGKANGNWKPSRAFSEPKKGTKINGGFFGQSSFARDIVVHQRGLVKVPDDFVDLEWAKLAALGCGIMTGAGAALNVLKPTRDQYVCIVGAGAVGLAAIMALKSMERPPRRIIAIDVVPAKLELARKYGATHGINSKQHKNLMGVLMDVTSGAGLDGSIDTAGFPEVTEQLIHATARKGKIVAIGVGKLEGKVAINTFEAVNAGLSYVGCNQGDAYPQEFVPWLLEQWRDGKFPYDDLIKTFHAKDMEKARRQLEAGKVVKAVLLWD